MTEKPKEMTLKEAWDKYLGTDEFETVRLLPAKETDAWLEEQATQIETIAIATKVLGHTPLEEKLREVVAALRGGKKAKKGGI